MGTPLNADLPSSDGPGLVHGLVSTIIPVHNRPALLREAVRSVLAQTYRPIEIIIVDDGSTDDTANVARGFASERTGETIHVIHQVNAGPGSARETGKNAARGEFIQYLDSDDILLARKLELQVAGLTAHPECAISYGMTNYCIRGSKASPIPWKRTGERISHVFPAMLQSRWWGTSTPLYRRTVVDRAGTWSQLKSEEDWEYDCRFGVMGVALHFVPEYVSEEHEHPGTRLSRAATGDPGKLIDIARARRLIFDHARSAGLATDLPEMRHFARELFLISRQCGAVGLNLESRELFDLSRTASGQRRANGFDFLIYKMAASVFGWSAIGRLACASDKLRR